MSELGKYSTSFAQRDAPPHIRRYVPFHFEVAKAARSKSGEMSQSAKYEESSTMVSRATPVANGSDRYFFSFKILATHPTRESEANPMLGVVGENLILTAHLPSGDFYASLGSVQEIGLRQIDFKNWRQFDNGTKRKDMLKTLKSRGGEPKTELKENLSKINFEFI